MKAALSMEELDLCKLLEVNDSAQRHACGGGQRTAAGTEKVG